MGAIEIATALAASRKAVCLYPPEHPTHREALTDLVASVTSTVTVRPLVLNVRDGRLYEGSDVLAGASPSTRALIEALEARRVESLTFHAGFGEIDGEGLSEVLSLKPSPDLQIQAELDARGVRAATVSELEDNTSLEAEERDRRREADRVLYRHALTSLKEIVAALRENETADAAVAVRSVAPLLERATADPHAILALATMTGHGEPWMFHGVSVLLYSLVIGQAMGLPDEQLVAVGTAALLHDAGGILSGGTETATERLSHPEYGALALGLVVDDDCTAMLVAYEHHMGVDGSGYPDRTEGYEPHPASRIVAVSDRFDQLLRGSGGSCGLRPDAAAVQLLREASGGALDPVIARLLVRIAGAFPVGCCVRLSDHSIGFVCAPGDDPLRPVVRLVLGADGDELRPVRDADLVEDERAVVEVLAADLLGLRASDYL